MTTKAFAQNGIVTDIARVDPFTIFQPAYAAQFIDAPDDVQPGWLYDGTTFTVAEASHPTLADFDVALTTHLDVTAQTRRYDNRITCAVRAGYPGPFQAEGKAFASWMDTCNALAYQIQAEVLAGTRPAPSTVSEFLSEMPEMVWPIS